MDDPVALTYKQALNACYLMVPIIARFATYAGKECYLMCERQASLVAYIGHVKIVIAKDVVVITFSFLRIPSL